MLLSSWEPEATRLANANGDEAAELLSHMALKYNADASLQPLVPPNR
jgi:hypothetical protein